MKCLLTFLLHVLAIDVYIKILCILLFIQQFRSLQSQQHSTRSSIRRFIAISSFRFLRVANIMNIRIHKNASGCTVVMQLFDYLIIYAQYFGTIETIHAHLIHCISAAYICAFNSNFIHVLWSLK